MSHFSRKKLYEGFQTMTEQRLERVRPLVAKNEMVEAIPQYQYAICFHIATVKKKLTDTLDIIAALYLFMALPFTRTLPGVELMDRVVAKMLLHLHRQTFDLMLLLDFDLMLQRDPEPLECDEFGIGCNGKGYRGRFSGGTALPPNPSVAATRDAIHARVVQVLENVCRLMGHAAPEQAGDLYHLVVAEEIASAINGTHWNAKA
jgi:hypothetical protein